MMQDKKIHAYSSGISSWYSLLHASPATPPSSGPVPSATSGGGVHCKITAPLPSKTSEGRGSVLTKAQALHQDTRGKGEPSRVGGRRGQHRGNGFRVSLDKQGCRQGPGSLHWAGRETRGGGNTVSGLGLSLRASSVVPWGA